MPLGHVIGLLIRPGSELSAIRAGRYSVPRSFFAHTALFALLPAVAGYAGTTQVGWQIGTGEPARSAGSRSSPSAPSTT